MKIEIDWDLCQGHGVCTEDAPDVFELDDDGKLVLKLASPEAGLHEDVRRAANYCPTQAINLVED